MKIRHEIDLKKNEPAPDEVAMSELSNGTKKHTSKSRETIPLIIFLGCDNTVHCLGQFFCVGVGKISPEYLKKLKPKRGIKTTFQVGSSTT
jgi:hypothetical protein